MAFKRKFGSDFPDVMLKVLQQLENPPLQETIINQIAEGQLPEMSIEDSSNLWTTLSGNLKKYFRNIVLAGHVEGQSVEGFVLKKIDAYHFMKTLLYLLEMTIHMKGENCIPLAAAHTMLVLSSILKSIKTDEQVETEMVPAGELWLERKLLLQNDLCTTIFHEMLIKSLRADAVEADISDMYGVQEWMCVSDIQSKSWPLLMLAMKNANYLKAGVGRSFLAFGMTLDRKLTEDLHKACKSNLSDCSEAEAMSYGLIYLEAWCTANVVMRKVIEEQCICDLINCVLTLTRKGRKMSSLGINILNLLHEFHSQKSCKDVCEMLSSKYDMLLWNGLKNASAHIRCNAVEILTDAFPLEKPSLSAIHNNEYLSKQRKVMTDLLNDVDSTVRGVAAREICNVITKFWAYIPPSTIQHWISVIVLHLRCSREHELKRNLYEGLYTLVMNPNQPYTKFLQQMLPDLQEQINDEELHVRAAFVELLLAIKNKDDIKIWNIIPLQHLITRLEEDESEVCELLVQLLYTTYFSRNRHSYVVVNCIMDMIQLSLQGTRKFFLHSESVIKFDAAIKLILQIMEHLLKHIQENYSKQRLIKDFCQPRSRIISRKKWKKRMSHRRETGHVKKVWLKALRSMKNSEEPVSSSDDTDEETEFFPGVEYSSSSDTEEETNIYEESKLRNPQICQGLLDVVCILFHVHSAKRKGKPIWKQWLKVYRLCKQCIPLFAMYFAGSCAFSSVLVMCSMVPVKLLKTIRMSSHMEALWKSKLQLLSCGDDSDEAIHLASFIWLKDCGKAVFMTASTVFSTVIASRIADATSSANKPRNMLLKAESDSLLKFKILCAAFTTIPCSRIVAQNQKYMINTWRAMEQIKTLIEIRLQNKMCFKDPAAGDRFIVECFSCYVKLIPVLNTFSTSGNFNNMDEYLRLLDWAGEVLLPGLPIRCPYENERSHFEWTMIETTGNLTVSLFSSMLEIMPTMMNTGHKISLFVYKTVKLCKRLLRTGCRLLFVTSCVTFLSKLYVYFKNNFGHHTLRKTLHMLLHLLMDCIAGFNDSIPLKNYLKPSIENYESVEYSIITTLLTSVKLCGMSSMMIIDVTRKFIDVILTTMTKGVSMLTDSDLRDVQDLPFIACRFVNIFINSDTLSEIFLGTLLQIVSDINAKVWQLKAGVKLLHILVYCPGVLEKKSLSVAVRKVEHAVIVYIAHNGPIAHCETDMKPQSTMGILFQSMNHHLAVT